MSGLSIQKKGRFCLWMGMDIRKKFDLFVRENSLLDRGDGVLLAVSGGVDSVVLMDLFLRIRSLWNLSLAVAHVNHGIRGRSADRDEVFVRDLARNRGLLFYSHKVDAKRYSRERKLSLEEGARELRFRFMESLLKRMDYDRLALGHHADDHAETILMNLVRGSGLRGLRGIRPLRGFVIHPLLFMRRKDIQLYAQKRGLHFVVDASNRERRFLRNRMRWDVLKKLENAVGSHVVSTISRAGDAVSEAQVLLEYQARRARRRIALVHSQNEIILDIYKFLHYFKAVQKTVLMQILEEFFCDRGRVRSIEIDRLLHLAEEGKSGGVVELGKGVKAVRSRDKLVFVRETPPFFPRGVCVGQPIDLSGTGFQFRSSLLKWDGEKEAFASNSQVEFLDYDTLPLPLALRLFRQGDWFIPLGMGGKKKLQDFFVDEGIPNYRRSSVPLLVGGESILWVVGYRIDDRFKVTEKTRNVLKVEIVPQE